MGSGLLAQPTNALSSLVFLAAGAWILARARRSPGRRTELGVFAAAVAANAAGGLLFHGVELPFARFVHDLAILGVLLFIGAFGLARLRGHPVSWTVRAYLAALSAGGLVLALLPGSADALFAVAGLAAGGLEAAEYRHELPAIRRDGLDARRFARLAVLAALALAVAAFAVGRSGAPLCRPGSIFQWHAVWHVLTAAAMALYAFGAIEPHPGRRQPGGGRRRRPRSGSQASARRDPVNSTKPASETSIENR